MVALTMMARPALAQNNGKGFLFDPPVGSFSIRGGYSLANAHSEVFAQFAVAARLQTQFVGLYPTV